jgi:hypothetical protein
MFILYEVENEEINNESIRFEETEDAIKEEMEYLIENYTKEEQSFGYTPAKIKKMTKNGCVLEWDDGEEFSIIIKKLVDF